ncbi:putative O-linked N-acetylglucosamine transferase (SPINDLY family) [Aquabacter spiritensis]|uniref:protein O-GlcNAc transferase n=2 Tax=Aquabacter spiritensis TaxID=933073 RepID=A0A4R3M864_9HYPH|nr:putative O-linked N-acetylglucosamine transferase (SPINDLY family) [Aquabacter spiritensis]
MLRTGYQHQMRGHLDEAVRTYRKLLQKVPDNVDVIHLLAMVRGKQGHFEDAIRLYRDALRRSPDRATLWYNLGLMYNAASRPAEAGDAYAQATTLDPALPEAVGLWYAARRPECDWRDHDRLAAAIAASIQPGHAPVQPFATLMLDEPALHLAAARHRCQCLRAQAPVSAVTTARRAGPWRIGYVSADFRDHAIAHLIARMLELHDRNRFEITAISLGLNDGSDYRARIEAGVDAFLDCATDPTDAIAAKVRASEIDILVDLMGHTSGNRIEIFCSRLAPVQVAFLGYPGTSGASEMDYIIADAAVLPVADGQFFSEAVVHLPDTYQACDPSLRVMPPPNRADCRLPDEALVFCAFNNLQKLDPQTFAIWMGLLSAVPESVLWLLPGNQGAITNLQREAAACGIDPHRLVFAEKVPVGDHLARLPLADLFLDAFPYTAHTTANDMLRMGVPIVTRRGRSFAARVAASLVTLMGCPELVAEDPEHYAAIALALARDHERRGMLRARLRDMRATSPLFDAARYVRHIESAYESMMARWLAGAAPAAFAVAPATG